MSADEQEKDKSGAGNLADDHAVQIMTTEHFTVQTARAATINESNGRASIFLSTVSSAIVALAFIGQASDMDNRFYGFALIILPCLFFLGVVTFERVLQTAIEDGLYAREINRIRHFYTEVSPQLARYFVLSTHDDNAGMFDVMGMKPSGWQMFLTSSGMISVINSVLAAAFVALGLGLLGQTTGIELIVGVIVFIIVVVLHHRRQAHMWSEDDGRIPVLFPSPANRTESRPPTTSQ